ncbi:hypothetical protein ACF0H5_002343 [Mactra antiquata]
MFRIILSFNLFIGLGLVPYCNADHFRGGTINWRPTGNPNEVEFTYTIGWRYNHGPGCTAAIVGQYINFVNPPSYNHMRWVCIEGCNPDDTVISDAGYTCKAASVTQEWEQGEYTFRYTFNSKGPFTIEYTSGAWVNLTVGVTGSFGLQTTVDLRSRSDTMLPNSSPTVIAKPEYTIKYGCTGNIRLPVLDVQGDNIRCRWAVGQECVSICGTIPNIVLDEENCVLNVRADHTPNGLFAVALMVEDYAKSTITLDGVTFTPSDVLSSVPVQFLIRTPEIHSRQCNDKPIFVYPTPPESDVIVVAPGDTMYVGFYATSPGTTIQSFLPIGPPDLRQSNIRQLSLRPSVYAVDVMWTPKPSDKGLKTLCSEATDAYLINSDLRCITIAAWDIDPCTSNPCQHSGTCARVGYTDDYECICLPGYTGQRCETDINECASNPCMNGAICFDLINEYFCGCADGYTDTNCQTDINECDFQDCLNGGTCIDTVGMAVCHCKPGFTGTVCQTGINHCESNPCENGATCVYNETTGFKCECPDGWSGIHCAYRHENETFVSNFSMTTDYMHYSSCECYFGHDKQELCYNYNQSRGSLFGLLGAFLGILTSIFMYIVGLCCLSKPSEHNDIINDEDDTTSQKNKKRDGCVEHDDENDDDGYGEDHSNGKTDPTTNPKHMHCWACAVKYNQLPAPRYWCNNKPYY